MRQRPRRHDGVGHLRRRDEVDLEQLGLQRALRGVVGRERVEQKRRRLADHVALQEEVRGSADLDSRAGLLDDLLGQRDCGVGRVHHQLLQQGHIVGRRARLRRVLRQLGEVALGGQRLHHLGLRAAGAVDLQGALCVARGPEGVAQGLASLELAVPEPALEEVFLVLGEDQLGELRRLERGEPAPRDRQQRPEVHQQRGGLAGRGRHGLELFDRLARAQGPAGGLCGRGRRGLEVARRKQALKVCRRERVCPGQTPALGQRQRQLDVVQLVGHERHHRGLIQRRVQHLPSPVDEVDAPRRGAGHGQEDGVGRHPVAVDGRARREVVDEQQAHLGHHVDQAEPLGNVQRDREVVGELGGKEELGRLFQRRRAAGVGAELNDVQLGRSCGLLRERDHGHAGAVGELHRREGRGVGFERLRAALLGREELHGAAHERRAVGCAGRDADEDAPLLVRGGAVGDDLAQSFDFFPVEGVAREREEEKGKKERCEFFPFFFFDESKNTTSFSLASFSLALFLSRSLSLSHSRITARTTKKTQINRSPACSPGWARGQTP